MSENELTRLEIVQRVMRCRLVQQVRAASSLGRKTPDEIFNVMLPTVTGSLRTAGDPLKNRIPLFKQLESALDSCGDACKTL